MYRVRAVEKMVFEGLARLTHDDVWVGGGPQGASVAKTEHEDYELQVEPAVESALSAAEPRRTKPLARSGTFDFSLTTSVSLQKSVFQALSSSSNAS